MRLMNQPFKNQALGDQLIKLIDSNDYHTLNIVVAFAKNSGVNIMKDYFQKFRDKGCEVNINVGIDLNGTSYEALFNLLYCTDSLNVIHTERLDQTFHTKIYQFIGKKKAFLIVGSHNLTRGGLWTNFESSIHIPINVSDYDDAKILKAHNNYLNDLISLGNSCRSINKKDDIDLLLNDGYIMKEVSQKFNKANQSKSIKKKQPFGNGIPTNDPKARAVEIITNVGSLKSKDVNIEDKVFWYETKQMTGGSSNIIDLSMTSKVEKGYNEILGSSLDIGKKGFMNGAVAFFGVNPNQKNQVKYITLNFEGKDYMHNKILFAENNGSWRLQIKGVGATNNKITEAFASKHTGYLKNKIITFRKDNKDLFYISVFPDSDLDDFKKNSIILGRNGSSANSKQIGYL